MDNEKLISAIENLTFEIGELRNKIDEIPNRFPNLESNHNEIVEKIEETKKEIVHVLSSIDLNTSD